MTSTPPAILSAAVDLATGRRACLYRALEQLTDPGVRALVTARIDVLDAALGTLLSGGAHAHAVDLPTACTQFADHRARAVRSPGAGFIVVAHPVTTLLWAASAGAERDERTDLIWEAATPAGQVRVRACQDEQWAVDAAEIHSGITRAASVVLAPSAVTTAAQVLARSVRTPTVHVLRSGRAS